MKARNRRLHGRFKCSVIYLNISLINPYIRVFFTTFIKKELHDWYAANGEYEILIGASSRDIRLSEKVQYVTETKLPLKLSVNTTFGELLADERTREYGKKLKHGMDVFFNGGKEPEEGASDPMGDAIAFSMPLRNAFSFGICSKEEVKRELEELQKLQ